MRVGIGVRDGEGAHSTFYRAEEGVKGRGGGQWGWIFNPHWFQH
jgi:hypothetical protein